MSENKKKQDSDEQFTTLHHMTTLHLEGALVQRHMTTVHLEQALNSPPSQPSGSTASPPVQSSIPGAGVPPSSEKTRK
ncbi:MAG: hypothetical protein J0G95_09010 [Rhizobiales bacterium]|nr:hypothetical protein [Hyphomicrobiales bacterium]